MKKILLGCTALSVILIGAAVIGFQKKQASVQPSTSDKPAVATQPAEPLNADAAQDKNTAPVKPEGENVAATPQNTRELQGLRFYSESEEQILEAFENYIYFKNLNSTMRPDIKTDGRDFIITFSDPSNINAEQRDLKMTRIEDFDSKAQYRITTQSWVVWNEMVKQAFANADLSMDSFNEVVSWVPDLSLKTNDSIKATGIKLTSDDVNFTADSIVFDLLVGPHDNKMDIASSTDINNLTLTTPIATLSIPKMTENLQVIGSDITPNETLQILTAEQSQSTTTIPTLSVQSSMLGAQPLTAKMDSQVVFAETMKVDLDISDIRAGQILLPLMPNKVTAKFEVTGVDKDILTEYVKMQQAYNEMDDNDSDEAKKLEENLVAIQNKVLTNLGVNIEHITVSNENAGLDLSGVIHYAEPALTVSAKLAVTNFDLISPKAAPIDEEACKAALETQSVSQNTAGTLPPVCMQQAGALEFLRPYLETAQHTKDAAGRPVDTFIIVYSANSLTINGEPVLVPANEAADNNEAKK